MQEASFSRPTLIRGFSTGALLCLLVLPGCLKREETPGESRQDQQQLQEKTIADDGSPKAKENKNDPGLPGDSRTRPGGAAPREPTFPKFKTLGDAGLMVPGASWISVAWSREGLVAAADAKNSRVAIWNPKGERVERLGLEDAHSLCFDESDHLFVATSKDVAILDKAGRRVGSLDVKVKRCVPGPSLAIRKGLAAFATPASLDLYDLAQRKRLKSIALMARSVALSPNGTTLAAVPDYSPSAELYVWDVKTSERRVSRSVECFFGVAFGPDETQLAASGVNGGIGTFYYGIVFDVTSWKELSRRDNPSIFSIAFSPIGSQLASGRSGHCNVFDIGSSTYYSLEPLNERDSKFPVHRGDVATAFEANGERLAWVNGGPRVELWDCQTKKEDRAYGHYGAVVSLAFSPDSLQLASGDATNLYVWDISTRHKVNWDEDQGSSWLKCVLREWREKGKKPADAAGNEALSADRATIAYATKDGEIVLKDVKTGDRLRLFEQPIAGYMATFSPDKEGKQLLAVAEERATIRSQKRFEYYVTIWDFGTRAKSATFGPLEDRVTYLELSRDNRYLALVGARGVEIWSLGRKEQILSVNSASAARFDGESKLAVGMVNGEIRLYERHSGD